MSLSLEELRELIQWCEEQWEMPSPETSTVVPSPRAPTPPPALRPATIPAPAEASVSSASCHGAPWPLLPNPPPVTSQGGGIMSPFPPPLFMSRGESSDSSRTLPPTPPTFLPPAQPRTFTGGWEYINPSLLARPTPSPSIGMSSNPSMNSLTSSSSSSSLFASSTLQTPPSSSSSSSAPARASPPPATRRLPGRQCNPAAHGGPVGSAMVVSPGRTTYCPTQGRYIVPDVDKVDPG
ncbi:hypothetical protein CI109_104746 [Kwoniella shandongensis]|uniref:Uncharacterized protein n=1 Tax=Kwoniella shandongensis TaxID=1734106 RepID=A0A5M6BRG0_9TREE|nr:uncharacterized protein CI109_006985 [Kwoniella shandongensis]KAA5524662.1 hypothetical protein CI109_006985 [Kwoniella shandongensis]